MLRRLCALLLLLIALGGNAQRNEVQITDENVERFAELLSSAAARTTFVLSVPVQLSSVAVITTNRVRLQGQSPDNRPVIQCRSNRDTGFEINADRVEFSDLIIRDCRGTAVSVSDQEISDDPFAQQDASSEPAEPRSLAVTFRNIDFLNNTALEENNSAGAIYLDRRAEAKVVGCLFEGNSAPTGGAINTKSASLTVRDSVFRDNSATSIGGAIYGSASSMDRGQNLKQETTMEIINCTFLNSRVLRGGRDRSGLIVEGGASLETNPYLNFPFPSPSGGALCFLDFTAVNISGSTFDNNAAVPAGGALYIGDNRMIEIRNCTFVNNYVAPVDIGAADAEDLQLGGALFVAFTDLDARLEIFRSTFRNNSAVYGGAIHFVGPTSGSFLVRSNLFRDNRAFLGGGAVALRNINQPVFTICLFVGNSALVGGAIFVTNGGGLTLERGSFEARTELRQNVAYDGGALFAMGAGTIRINFGNFIQNQAERHGGAICIIDTKAGGIAIIQASYFFENKAERGAAAFLENLVSVSLLRASQQEAGGSEVAAGARTRNEFIGNEAVAGGALYYAASNLLSNSFAADFCDFINNTVHSDLSSIFDGPLEYPKREDTIGGRLGRRLSVQSNLNAEDSMDNALLDPLSLEPCYPGGGGAICLSLTDVSQGAPVSVTLQRIQFKNNTAFVGGALLLATDESVDWKQQCPDADHSTARTLTSDPCRTASLTELSFVENNAILAGGAMFASNMSHIWYSESAEVSENTEYNNIASIASTRVFRRNSVGRGGYGPNIAGNVVSLNLSNPIPHPETGYLISNQSTGQSNPLEEINIEVLDGLGQVIADGITDTNLRVRVRATRPLSNTSVASGQVASIAEGGIVRFEALSLLAPAGTYTLEFLPSRHGIDPVLGEVEVRPCLLGEVNDTAGLVCEFCPFEFFSLDTSNSTCDPCPPDARCSGGYSIVPLPNYWHSSPFSTIMHECFHHEACEYRGRTQHLEESLVQHRLEFLERVENEEEPIFNEEEYKQCADGYEGPLCGACAEGYGLADGKTCVECSSRIGTAAIVFVIAIWQLILLLVTIRSALVSMRDMNQMMMLMNQSTVPTVPSSGLPTLAGTSTGGQNLPTVLPSTQHMKDRTEIPQRSSENPTDDDDDRSTTAASQTTNQPTNQAPNQTPSLVNLRQNVSIDYIIAAQHVSETIKIFVNFLQVTSVGVNINVDWTTTVRNMLATMNSIAGFSSGASFTPMSCMLDTSPQNRSIYGVIMRITFPLGLMLLVMVFFYSCYLFMLRTPTLTRRHCSFFIRSRLIICFLVVGFFSYQSISEELMGTVSCIDLDKDEINDDTAYPQYATARDRYWNKDTNIECFERKHAYLVGFLGVPGIIFFLIGIPAYLLFFLLYKRSQNQLWEMDVLNTYGFIYQNYEDKFVYWEVCILIRKALIGAIIVFAYPLGANLQGIMALGVLILALGFHLIAAPFKYFLLNILEGCSLLVSSFTFYVGIVFNDENTSHAADILLSTLLALINLSLVVVFLVCVFKHADKYVTAKLKYLDVKDIPANFCPRVAKLATVMIGQATHSLAATVRQTLRRRRPHGTIQPGVMPTARSTPRRNVLSPRHRVSSSQDDYQSLEMVEAEPQVQEINIELTPGNEAVTHDQ